MATLLVGQAPISNIIQSVQWDNSYGSNIPPPPSRCGGGYWFPVGTIVKPFPYAQANSVIAPMTGYTGDPAGGNCWGLLGSLIYQANAIQGGPRTFGLSLSPRALSAKGFNYAILINHYFCNPMPRPWSNHNGLQMQADLCLPFVYVPNVAGDSQIASQGTVFCYFVAQLQNVIDTTQVIYFNPRILQNQYPVGDDASNAGMVGQFGSGNQAWMAGPNIPILYPQIVAGNAWLTTIGSGRFNIGHNSSVLTYGFSVNATQFATAINGLNAAHIPGVTRHDFDPVAAHWQLRLVNLDFEAWGSNPASDPRFGLNVSNFLVWIL